MRGSSVALYSDAKFFFHSVFLGVPYIEKKCPQERISYLLRKILTNLLAIYYISVTIALTYFRFNEYDLRKGKFLSAIIVL